MPLPPVPPPSLPGGAAAGAGHALHRHRPAAQGHPTGAGGQAGGAGGPGRTGDGPVAPGIPGGGLPAPPPQRDVPQGLPAPLPGDRGGLCALPLRAPGGLSTLAGGTARHRGHRRPLRQREERPGYHAGAGVPLQRVPYGRLLSARRAQEPRADGKARRRYGRGAVPLPGAGALVQGGDGDLPGIRPRDRDGAPGGGGPLPPPERGGGELLLPARPAGRLPAPALPHLHGGGAAPPPPGAGRAGEAEGLRDPVDPQGGGIFRRLPCGGGERPHGDHPTPPGTRGGRRPRPPPRRNPRGALVLIPMPGTWGWRGSGPRCRGGGPRWSCRGSPAAWPAG